MSPSSLYPTVIYYIAVLFASTSIGNNAKDCICKVKILLTLCHYNQKKDAKAEGSEIM
jgi:hypothetical protein